MTESKAPDPEVSKRILEFIGVPPRAKTFRMIHLQFPEVSEDDLCRVLDGLYERREIGEMNGWIHGYSEQARRIRHAMENLSEDDVAWLTGTGRFAQ